MCVCVCVCVSVQVLKAKSSQYLTDYHLWLSAFVKPSYSRFTRSQRLTCCLCLIMSYMAASVLWWHYFTDQVISLIMSYLAATVLWWHYFTDQVISLAVTFDNTPDSLHLYASLSLSLSLSTVCSSASLLHFYLPSVQF